MGRRGAVEVARQEVEGTRQNEIGARGQAYAAVAETERGVNAR